MSVASLLAEAKLAGIRIRLESGKVLIKAKRKPLEELLAALKAHREEIITSLKEGEVRDAFDGEPAGPFAKTLAALESRCPDHVDEQRWQQTVTDARGFFEAWGARAAELGWTARELLGLHTPPEKPHPSYDRLSRYDETGVLWMLSGNTIIALDATSASIRHRGSGSITVYRKERKPALAPLGDSLDDFK